MAAYAGFMTHIISKLIAKNRDQLRNPTLINRVWATLDRVRGKSCYTTGCSEMGENFREVLQHRSKT